MIARRSLPAMAFSALVLAGAPALASGNAVREQSISRLGNAQAGAGATADDPATLFFNPAGLARLTGSQIQLGGTYSDRKTVFLNAGSRGTFGAFRGGPGGDAGFDMTVPFAYVVWDAHPDLKIGVGITSPHARNLDYDDDWLGRYHVVSWKLATTNIQPTVAYRLTEKLSLGAGLQIQHAEATHTRAVDFGTLCLPVLQDRACGLLGLSQQSSDGHLRVTGEDWGYGFTLGLHYQLLPSTKVGVSFRSDVSHRLTGEADFTVPANATVLTAGGQFTDTSATGSVRLPETLSFSLAHDLDERWTLLGDVTITNWSRFREVRFDFGGPLPSNNTGTRSLVVEDSVRLDAWQDTIAFAAGANFKVSETLTLRFGAAFETSPVRDDYRSVRWPDQDQFRLAVGASYAPSPAVRIDVGYAHIFAGRADIRDERLLLNRLFGSVSNDVDILGIATTFRF